MRDEKKEARNICTLLEQCSELRSAHNLLGVVHENIINLVSDRLPADGKGMTQREVTIFENRMDVNISGLAAIEGMLSRIERQVMAAARELESMAEGEDK